MKLTKTISALLLSLVLLVGSLGQANAAKRLHAAIAVSYTHLTLPTNREV